MKKLFILLLIETACAAGIAENVPFGEIGQPFHPGTNLVIRWNASAKELPANLWVYHVLPSKFSPAMVSNLMALGSFSAKDVNYPHVLNPVFNEPDALIFRSADRNKQLYIYPDLGWIYYDNANVASSHETNGLPRDESETLRLAAQYVERLGIDPSQLATKPHSTELAASYVMGKLTVFTTNKSHFSFVNLRGVMISRKIGGVDFWAKGTRDGFNMTFGPDGKISRLEILWRSLAPDTLCPVATPKEFLKWIHGGKSVWDNAGLDDFDWALAKEMTVNDVTPYYFGTEHDVVQNSLYPFAMLKTTVKTGTTNRTVYLYCPIINDTNPSTKRLKRHLQ